MLNSISNIKSFIAEEFLDGDKAFVKGDCIECGHCVALCPTGAVSIEGYDMDDVEVYDEDTFKVNPQNLLRAIKFRRSIRFYKDEKVKSILLNDTELHDNINEALKNLDKAVLNVDTIVMSIKARPFIQKKLPK